MPVITSPSNIPSNTKASFKIDKFRGVDFTSGVLSINAARSPEAVNMIPDLDGFPTKRHGCAFMSEYPGRINGAHILKTETLEKTLIHAGTSLYDGENEIYTQMADDRSTSAQFENKLYIADGKRLLCYGEFNGEWTCKPCDEIGTVPVITIGRKPEGGGEGYNPVNLLSDKVCEQFTADGSSVKYQLSFNDLPQSGYIKVEIKNSAGEWAETTAYTVTRSTGIVNFNSAPAKPTVTGEDNVKITYQKTVLDENPINRCKKLILYGVNGQPDRLWLAGDDKLINYCRYSQYRDPLYIGDTWYLIAGAETAAVTGFSLLQNKLIIHKSGEEMQRNAYIIESGIEADGDATFKTYNILQGEGALCGFAAIGTEPLFLTSRGVYAVTASDVSGEKYTQNRSYYINGRLTKQSGLEQAQACVYGRFYVLSLNGNMYLLDSEQKTYERNSPYSTYQYECYYLTDIPSRVIWTDGKRLYFGTNDGKVYYFKKDGDSDPYIDEQSGKAVFAKWSTPLMSFGDYGHYKTISNAWVVCQPYSRSGAEVYFATDKFYKKFAAGFDIDIFDWNDIDFNRFTFNIMDRPTIGHIRRKCKKVKLFQLICENERAEAFGLSAIQAEYRVTSKIK